MYGNEDGWVAWLSSLYDTIFCILFALFSEIIFFILFKRLYVSSESLHLPLSRKDLDKSFLGFVLVPDGLGSFLKLCSEIIRKKTIRQPLEINTVDRQIFQGQNWIKIQRSNLYELAVFLLSFNSSCICDVKLNYISTYIFHNWSRTASPFSPLISLVLSLKIQLC